MKVLIKFLGGTKTVTGSKYLLEINGFKILIDCGLFQGLKELRLRNWDKLPIPIEEIDAVILTHAHIDHSGYLPKLFKDGFTGSVYCTHATADLAQILLKDSAKLQMEETDYAIHKGYSKHDKPQPLYDINDVALVLPNFVSFDYNQRVEINNNIHIIFRDASHILGSSIVEIEVKGKKESKKITFSGDLGRMDQPVHPKPYSVTETDVLFIESTYGDRVVDCSDVEQDFAKIIINSMERNGILLIPAFAVGRTQILLYYIKKLMDAKRIPKLPVYVDSPMAIDVTWLYSKYNNLHNLQDDDITDGGIFSFDSLHYVTDRNYSKQLNTIKKNAIIISASGMMTGGRVLHHLYNLLPKRNTTLLLAGYQAEGTRGRRIEDGEKEIKLLGEYVKVNCTIEKLDGLSAHADQKDLIDWLKAIKNEPKFVFLIHGESQCLYNYQTKIKEELGWNAIVPEYLENFELFDLE